MRETAVKPVIQAFWALILIGLAWQSAGAQAGENELYLPLIAGQFQLGPGSMSGMVLDSQTGDGLAGVTVCVDPTTNCALSDDDGRYLLTGIPAGMTQFTAYPSSLYYPVTQSKNVVAYQEGTLNFTLSFRLSEGEYRVILTWNPVAQYPGCNPGEEYLCNNDLDANLWVPEDLEYYRIYWGVIGDPLLNNCDGEPTFACIQSDARHGNGPETILILPVKVGLYHYAVFNYAHAVNPGLIPLLSQADAQVDVYGESGLLRTFRAPTTGTGDWWHVFDLDGVTQEIRPVNQVLDYQPFP